MGNLSRTFLLALRHLDMSWLLSDNKLVLILTIGITWLAHPLIDQVEAMGH